MTNKQKQTLIELYIRAAAMKGSKIIRSERGNIETNAVVQSYRNVFLILGIDYKQIEADNNIKLDN